MGEGPVEEGGEAVAGGCGGELEPVGLGEAARRRSATQEAEEAFNHKRARAQIGASTGKGHEDHGAYDLGPRWNQSLPGNWGGTQIRRPRRYEGGTEIGPESV